MMLKGKRLERVVGIFLALIALGIVGFDITHSFSKENNKNNCPSNSLPGDSKEMWISLGCPRP